MEEEEQERQGLVPTVLPEKKTLFVGRKLFIHAYEVGTRADMFQPTHGFAGNTHLYNLCATEFEEHVGKLEPGSVHELRVSIEKEVTPPTTGVYHATQHGYVYKFTVIPEGLFEEAFKKAKEQGEILIRREYAVFCRDCCLLGVKTGHKDCVSPGSDKAFLTFTDFEGASKLRREGEL